jgi:hypothetical protein
MYTGRCMTDFTAGCQGHWDSLVGCFPARWRIHAGSGGLDLGLDRSHARARVWHRQVCPQPLELCVVKLPAGMPSQTNPKF